MGRRAGFNGVDPTTDPCYLDLGGKPCC